MSTIAFLGAGNISQAIIGGLIENNYDRNAIIACDPFEESRNKAGALGARISKDNNAAIAEADLVMLCVKPNIVIALLEAISVPLGGKLIVSVAAGITTDSMASRLPDNTAIVRCMPNTPALVRTGMTALFAARAVSDRQKILAEEVLSAVGKTRWVDTEQALDAVTAVSGSGPAYFFLLMESMINAAIKEGLSEDVASQLVLQTALGAATMASGSGLSPGELRKNVTSPGGTTQAAIEHFETKGFAETVEGAVSAARVRSIELSAS
jgi:pyrroline-5-carboxylate reductase